MLSRGSQAALSSEIQRLDAAPRRDAGTRRVGKHGAASAGNGQSERLEAQRRAVTPDLCTRLQAMPSVSVRIPRAGGPVTMSLTLSSDATIADVEAAVRQTGEINPTKPISVLHAGRPLCSSDTLARWATHLRSPASPPRRRPRRDAPTPAPAPRRPPPPRPTPSASRAAACLRRGVELGGDVGAGRMLAPPPAAAAAPAAGLVLPRPTAPTLPPPARSTSSGSPRSWSSRTSAR